MTWEIIEGDCIEVMRGLAKADHVLTDPPYDSKTHDGARYGFRCTSSKIPFAPLDVAATVPSFLAASKRWILAFCALEMYGDYKRAAGSSWVRAGFWRRVNGVPQFTGDRPGQPGEGLAIMHSPDLAKRWNGKGKHGFWETPINCNGVHPTQKPITLMRQLVIDFTNPGDTILDPFCGSGTTGVACIETGRNFVGIEINPEYCRIARERCERAERQPDMFVRPAKAQQGRLL